MTRFGWMLNGKSARLAVHAPEIARGEAASPQEDVSALLRQIGSPDYFDFSGVAFDGLSAGIFLECVCDQTPGPRGTAGYRRSVRTCASPGAPRVGFPGSEFDSADWLKPDGVGQSADRAISIGPAAAIAGRACCASLRGVC